MPTPFLKKQLEDQRFRHAVAYISEAARSAKRLTTSELSRLNQIVTATTDENWRTEPVEIKIPGGRIQNFNLINNPVESARTILGDAFELGRSGEILKSAVYIYTQLVQEHLFVDANRRTAALAMQWLLNSHEFDIDPDLLLKVPVGNVRDPIEMQHLTEQIKKLIRPLHGKKY